MTHSENNRLRQIPQACTHADTRTEIPREVEHFLDILSSVLIRVVQSPASEDRKT